VANVHAQVYQSKAKMQEIQANLQAFQAITGDDD